MLSKNTRSGKIRQIAQNNNWQYQEFIDFSDAIKQANFGILNYSQNAIFRHVIQADGTHDNLGFNTFDCRAIEPTGIHNSSMILFNLKLPPQFNNLHFCIDRHNQESDAFTDVSKQQAIKNQYRMQKLTPLATHQIPKVFDSLYCEQNNEQTVGAAKIDIYANEPAQAYRFLHEVAADTENETSLMNWLLAHPHLHIEISSGMLLVYQKNHLIQEVSLIAAITVVAELAKILSQAELKLDL
ncbi:MAG: hypothetical protein V7765_14485 [Oleispira sp.]